MSPHRTDPSGNETGPVFYSVLPHHPVERTRKALFMVLSLLGVLLASGVMILELTGLVAL